MAWRLCISWVHKDRYFSDISAYLSPSRSGTGRIKGDEMARKYRHTTVSINELREVLTNSTAPGLTVQQVGYIIEDVKRHLEAKNAKRGAQ